MEQKYLVLVVEDDAGCAQVLTLYLQSTFRVEVVGTNAAAMERLGKEPKIDCMLLDLQLPNGDGLQLVRGFQETHPNVPMIVITGNRYCHQEVIEAGAHHMFSKPYIPKDLVDIVTHTIARHKVRGLFTPIQEKLEIIKQVVNTGEARAACADNHQQALVTKLDKAKENKS